MCNLYSLGKQGADALREFFGATWDETGNMPELPGIFPDQFAPVVRLFDQTRELRMMRWGLPGPTMFGGQSVNLGSPATAADQT